MLLEIDHHRDFIQASTIGSNLVDYIRKAALRDSKQQQFGAWIGETHTKITKAFGNYAVIALCFQVRNQIQ
jgi:hypothetical protein